MGRQMTFLHTIPKISNDKSDKCQKFPFSHAKKTWFFGDKMASEARKKSKISKNLFFGPKTPYEPIYYRVM